MDLVFVTGIVITVLTAIPVLFQMRKHPKGLFVLFFAEMWERFSYYGMRGLLVLYLTQHFLFDDQFSQGQYGAYTSLVYLLPLVGGFLADKMLGTRKAIAFGALLLVAGHFTMGIEGKPAVQTLTYASAPGAAASTYVFDVKGRGSSRITKLKVGDGLYDFGVNADGGFEIKGLPAGSAVPAVMPKGAYTLAVTKRDQTYVNIFYLALSLIIMGVGFLKANISTIVGQLYPQGDPRRDPGFTLYYYGINLGAFWAAIACGWLGEKISWSLGFGAAGAGMLLGYLVFVLGKPWLMGKGEPPNPEALKKPVIGPINREVGVYLLGIMGVGAVWALLLADGRVRSMLTASVKAFKLAHPGEGLPLALATGNFFALVGTMLLLGSIAVIGYLSWFMATKCNKVERGRLLLALVLIASSVVFWTLFEQAGSSLNLFADRNTDLSLPGGGAMTAAQVQSFNSGFILILAPIFSAIWAWLGTRGRDPNPVLKFSLGLIQVGLAFMLVVWGASFHNHEFKIPLIFLATAYLVQTTAELCLSPVGLSQMTKLSAAAVVSTVMATWFLASAWAQWLGGLMAGLTSADTVAGQVLDPGKALATYVAVYSKAGLITIAIGIGLLVLSPLLKRLAYGLYDGKAQMAEDPEPPVDGERQTVPQG